MPEAFSGGSRRGPEAFPGGSPAPRSGSGEPEVFPPRMGARGALAECLPARRRRSGRRRRAAQPIFARPQPRLSLLDGLFPPRPRLRSSREERGREAGQVPTGRAAADPTELAPRGGSSLPHRRGGAKCGAHRTRERFPRLLPTTYRIGGRPGKAQGALLPFPLWRARPVPGGATGRAAGWPGTAFCRRRGRSRLAGRVLA